MFELIFQCLVGLNNKRFMILFTMNLFMSSFRREYFIETLDYIKGSCFQLYLQ